MPSDPPIFPPENNLKQADFASITNESLPKIIEQFNQENDSTTRRPSILKNINFLGFSLFTYRMVEKNQMRLVQRNGVPELAGYSGYYQRRIKIWSLWKPWTWFRIFRDNSSTIGIFDISGDGPKSITKIGHIGYGNRHLVNVNPGEYAKVIINSKAVLLDEGAHVIKEANFKYIGKELQSTSFIKHENLYRLQVPSAKIAAVIVDNEPYLLGTGIYYVQSNNFQIIQKTRDSYFYDTQDSVIGCGSLLRIMPPPNTVAVYNIGSKRRIFPDRETASSSRNKEENQVGIIEQDGILTIRNPNVEFVTFLKTDLINKDYPSTVGNQFTYYTNSVKIGVKLFVAYRITDAKLAIKELGPMGIDEHIERVTHVDMARAGQESSLQGIQASGDLNLDALSTSGNDDNPPAYDQINLNTLQKSVMERLKNDLEKYGITLVRLNIEEINILNKDVENEMGKQAVAVAKARADLGASEMQKIVAFKNAQIASEVAQLQAQQVAATKLIEAENNNEIAELNKKTTLINAEAEAGALKLLGKTLSDDPNLLRFKLAEINATAFRHTNIHTFFGNGDSLSQSNSNSPLSLPNLIRDTNLLSNT